MMLMILMSMALGQSDFMTLVATGDVKNVEEVLASNPSLAMSRDKNGVSALLAAVFRYRKPIVELLLSANIPLDVFEAAAVGRTDRALELISREPSLLNAYAPYGFFPLGLAVFFGHEDTVKALIDAGADLNLQSRETMRVSALHSAVAAGRPDIAEILLDHGANPNLKASQDFRPLHEAAARGNLELVKALLKAGAEINAKTTDGKTPLAFAIEHQQGEMAAFLKSVGATQ